MQVIVVGSMFNNRNVKIYSSAGTPYPPVLYSNSLAGRTYAQSFDLARDHTSLFNSVFINSSSKHPFVIFSSRINYYFTYTYGTFEHDRISLFNSSGLPSSKSQAFAEWISSIKNYALRFPKTHFVVVLPVPTFDKLYPNWICNLNSFRPSLPSHCFSKLPRLSFV